MKHLSQSIGTCVGAALFAACGGANGIAPSTAAQHAAAHPSGYKVLYAFTGGREDGANPNYGPLIDVGGVLYGTTYAGGTDGRSCPAAPGSNLGVGCGTFYRVDPSSGTESVLYNFGYDNDAAHPLSGVAYLNGEFYGTTFNGGTSSYCRNGSPPIPGCGTIFEVAPDGTGEIVYSFKGGRDGQFPQASLVAVDGALYGSTNSGGSHGGNGTIFSYTPSGGKTTLYSFRGGSHGGGVEAPLLAVGGVLYGTAGGDTKKCGCGIIFALSGSVETVLYRFRGAPDAGGNEGAGDALIDVNGTLYGTTVGGGHKTCYPSGSGDGGCGTVFTYATSSGTESVLRAFGGSNGEIPLGGLAELNGKLYGTTITGGANGRGVIYEVDPSTGKERVIHSFRGGHDGSYPEAGLFADNGVLYGTTERGGGSRHCPAGCGTVFEVTP